MQSENDHKRTIEEFSVRLRSAMAKAGLNAYALSKGIGVSHTTVNRWLEGGEPKLSDLLNLGVALNESVHYLVTGNQASPAESSMLRQEPAPYDTDSRSNALANLLSSIIPKIGAPELMEAIDVLNEMKPPGWEALSRQAIDLLRQKLNPP